MREISADRNHHGDNDSAEDAVPSTQKIELRLADLQQQLADLDETAPLAERLQLELDSGYALLELNRFDEASKLAHTLFDRALDAKLWQHAVEACDILFQSEQADSVIALAHGIWLGVTFPIDPELTVAMLQHLIDETPDRSDGAAVAAAVANYIVDLRADEQSGRTCSSSPINCWDRWHAATVRSRSRRYSIFGCNSWSWISRKNSCPGWPRFWMSWSMATGGMTETPCVHRSRINQLAGPK